MDEEQDVKRGRGRPKGSKNKNSADELNTDNQFFVPYDMTRKSPDPPVFAAFGYLNQEHGAGLELQSRIFNDDTNRAVMLSVPYIEGYNSKIVRCKKDTMLRMTVGKFGIGRKENVDALQAGAFIPSDYYSGGRYGPNSRVAVNVKDLEE